MRIDSINFNPIIRNLRQKPANIGIEQKMTSAINAYNQGSRNTESVGDLLKTADGALGSASDALNQIKELAVKAGNGTYTDDERQMIQSQIEELKSSISDTLANTEFNRIKIFNGNDTLDIQTGNQGRVMELKNTSLETLGIADLDVTKSIDLASIAKASQMITDARGKMGAVSNGLESTVRSNQIAAENIFSARSNLETDFTTQISDIRRNSILQQYRIATMGLQMESQKSKLNLLM